RQGFESGWEESLPKLFHLKEFIIRGGRLLARQRPPEPLRVGGLLLDFDAMSVESSGGGKVFLQVRDSRVLKLLVDAAPRVVNRSEILDRVWGEDHFPTPRAVDNAIVRLRQALGDEDAQL